MKGMRDAAKPSHLAYLASETGDDDDDDNQDEE